MEEDFIHCMLFVTFVVIVLYIIIKPFMSSTKLPFHIKRKFKANIENSDAVLDNMSFNGIPAIIYQSYTNNTNISSDIANIINENVSNNNEFEYYIFNNDDSRLFIESNFEEDILDAYDNLDLVSKNNLWKYCILYKNGGVYLDINISIKHNLITTITPALSELPINNNIILTKNKNLISNKLIIAPPNLPIFKELIDSYLSNHVDTLSSLIEKYNYKNNIKFYVGDGYIKNINTNEIDFIIN